jgi:hypothetical protein
MNIDQIISEYKCKKLGSPVSAIKIADIPSDVFLKFRDTISSRYNLVDQAYATKESVFFDTRRIVAKTPFIKTTEQKYTNLDFDYKLFDICLPIIEQVNQYLPNAEPTLVQLATVLPNQKLTWHVDTYLYQQFSNKIHIPLYTNPNATYEVFLENKHYEKINMTEGSIWNIDNLVLHRSVNNGNTFRTHLIIDFIDKTVLAELEKLEVNYFHHNLPYMTEYASKITELLKSLIK